MEPRNRFQVAIFAPTLSSLVLSWTKCIFHGLYCTTYIRNKKYKRGDDNKPKCSDHIDRIERRENIVRGQSYGWRLTKYWPPTPLTTRRVCTLVRGEDTLAGWRGGWGVNILEDVRHSSVLYVCKYFVEQSIKEGGLACSQKKSEWESKGEGLRGWIQGPGQMWNVFSRFPLPPPFTLTW
jgi:hypothetical protein